MTTTYDAELADDVFYLRMRASDAATLPSVLVLGTLPRGEGGVEVTFPRWVGQYCGSSGRSYLHDLSDIALAIERLGLDGTVALFAIGGVAAVRRAGGTW